MRGILASLLAVTAATAADPTDRPYAGQEDRAIPALSEDDIAALERGEGWGFAKPAELNGWPGPAHVLEHAEALGLSAAQRAAVLGIHEDMRTQARRLGRDYVVVERALDTAFKSGRPTPETVAALAVEAGRLRAELRAVHLIAHLKTQPLLSAAQIETYARLRGYRGAQTNPRPGGPADHDGHGAHRGH